MASNTRNWMRPCRKSVYTEKEEGQGWNPGSQQYLDIKNNGEETAKESEEKQPKRKGEKYESVVPGSQVRQVFPEGVTSLAKPCKTFDRSNKTGVESYHGVGNIVVTDKPDKHSFDGTVVEKKKKPSRSGSQRKQEAEG